MAKQIKGNEIIEDNHLANAIKQAEDLLTAYKNLDEQIVKTAKGSKKIASATDLGSAKGIKTINQELRKSNELKKAAASIDKQIEKGEAKLTLAYTTQAKRLANLKLIQQRANKAAKEAAILSSKSSTQYEKESVRLNQLRKKLKDLILTEGQSSKATRQMQKEVQRLDQRLKKADAAAGQFQRSVGGYRQAITGAVGSLKNLASALGVVGGVRLLTNIMRDSFNVVKDFGQSQADLASVLGKNIDEIKGLTEAAKELGATTKFTASEVANLQISFAKLGFPEEDIKNMTKATLELAAAAGTDLDNAATIVGSTLNAFGLESTETQRLVDVMAKSFSSSSLDIDKFSSAMSNVAPAAAAIGLSIEETTALIGTLTDAGNDAGAAGTGLRNMFIQTKAAGITFEEALDQIENSTDQLGTSFELFGKKGATLGVTLANNRDGAAALTDKLENAAGAAGDMADKQLDTLNGALALLRSAWEGYILGADGASGISDKLKDIVKFLADNLETILDTVVLVVKVFTVYKAAVLAQTLATQLLNQAQILATVGIKNYTKAARTASKVNPFGLIATALIVIIPLIKDFVSSLFEAEEELGAVAEAQKVVNTELAKEQAKLNTKFELLKKTNPQSEERLRLINDINDTYGTTLENMEDEADFAEQLKVVYEELNAQLEKKIRTRVFEQAAETLIAENVRLEKAMEDVRNGVVSLQDVADEFDVSLIELATGELGNRFQQNVKDIDDLLNSITELSQTDVDLPGTGDEDGDGSGSGEGTTEKAIKKLGKDAFKLLEDGSEAFDPEADFASTVRSLKANTVELERELRARGASAEEIQKALEDQELENLKAKRNRRLELFGEFDTKFLELDLELRREIDRRNAEQEKEDEDRLKKAKEAREKELAETLKALKTFGKQAEALFKTIADSQIKEIDRVIKAKQEDIQESDQQINRLQALADQGNVEAAESLKAENIKQAKDKLEVERLEKKKKNLLIQLAFLQQANNLLQKQDPNALSNALTSVGTFTDKIKGFFYGGTDKTVGHALGNTGTRDGHIVAVHDNEHIVGAEDSDRLHKAGFENTSDIVNAALAHQNNAVNGRVMLMNTGISWTDAGIIQAMKENTQAIKDIKHPTSVYDQETGKEIVRDGDTVNIYNHKPKTFII